RGVLCTIPHASLSSVQETKGEPECTRPPNAVFGAYNAYGERPMLERLLLPENHAISILIKDHDRVKDLFDRFEKSESGPEKQRIVKEALSELKIHAVIEEEIFYPAVRKYVEKDLMNEAD